MSQSENSGSIAWIDLTVENAEEARDFYSEVVGWEVTGVDMGGYEDFTMVTTSEKKPAAGICHARGLNASMPPQWLIYILVDNLEQSLEKCLELGGEIVVPARSLPGHGRYCVIRDPAGAVSALFEQES